MHPPCSTFLYKMFLSHLESILILILRGNPAPMIMYDNETTVRSGLKSTKVWTWNKCLAPPTKMCCNLGEIVLLLENVFCELLRLPACLLMRLLFWAAGFFEESAFFYHTLILFHVGVNYMRIVLATKWLLLYLV